MTKDELLEKAGEHIKMLDAEIQRLMSPPHQLVTVLEVIDTERVLVSGGSSGATILAMPEGQSTMGLLPGQLLTVNAAGAVVDRINIDLSGGEATVRRSLGKMLEVNSGMGATLIFSGRLGDTAKPGDTVQLDRSGQIALRVIPKDISPHSIDTSTGVSWADIGGQEEAKASLREAIEGPICHAQLFKAYGKKPLKGVLLSGAPGCGKTLLAKATANAIRELHGTSEASSGFIYIKGPEVLNMWVGNTEASIRGLFAQAKEHHATFGYPAVIFIDEADAILGKRGSSHGSVLASTVVPAFLAEMDGMSDSGAFILLATNRQDILDPAIVREGRIDRKIRVGRPKLKDAVQILGIHLGKTKVSEDVSSLAGIAAADLFFSDTNQLYRVSIKGKGVQIFHVRHLISGAMLAGIVDMATSNAIARDSKAPKSKASGLCAADLTLAIAQMVKSNRYLNHDDDLMLFAEEQGAEIEAVQRIAA